MESVSADTRGFDWNVAGVETLNALKRGMCWEFMKKLYSSIFSRFSARTWTLHLNILTFQSILPFDIDVTDAYTGGASADKLWTRWNEVSVENLWRNYTRAYLVVHRRAHELYIWIYSRSSPFCLSILMSQTQAWMERPQISFERVETR